ncbi:uncharacterized protein YlxW (UPF0749 family) [Gracilibacillus halotolerans]|uniref:Uncharacterized protein YlxW (UPF0749 family) n=1 Tax=Gracilibacillus halotolerans TaxID=74386 RepID=A0A841RHM5_9BACI|nr:DUF881 domain-containing protein [Gracilibacillus halotolerans]MBB6511357.1 uncharacterized protein YlxW (UPF0749 family) [Gracilibacillus halotolerans]
MRGRQVVYAFVFLLIGFLLTVSIQHANRSGELIQLNESNVEQDLYYRDQLIDVQEKNKQLRSELVELQENVQNLEQEIANDTDELKDLVNRKNTLQKFTGELPIEGEGIQITLSDTTYDMSEEDHANQYVVHDRHIHLLINELFSAGAKAIAINGQRIYHDSHITCIGPVISVEGNVYPAPFVISAIGDQNTLDTSIQMRNGVIEYLVQDNIDVKLDLSSNIMMREKDSL